MSHWTERREEYEEHLEQQLREAGFTSGNETTNSSNIFHKKPDGRVYLVDSKGNITKIRIDLHIGLELNNPDVIAAQIAAGIATEGKYTIAGGNHYRFSTLTNTWCLSEQKEISTKTTKPTQIAMWDRFPDAFKES